MAEKTKHWKAPLISALEAKIDGDMRRISGYASIFNEVDNDGDHTVPGAFSKTINERVQAGKVALMARHYAHGGDVLEAIGVVKEAREDERGLWVEADLFDSELARETHAKISQSPQLFGMSIGGIWVKTDPIKNDEGKKTGLVLKEVALYEVTITLMPSCEGTIGTVEAKKPDTEITEEEDAGTTADAPPVATPSFKAEIRRRERVLALLKLRLKRQ